MSDEPELEQQDGDAAPLGPDAIKKAKLLTAYASCGVLTQACQEVGITRRTHYWWLESDPAYVLRYQDAQEAAIDVLEAEARRRALGVAQLVQGMGGEDAPKAKAPRGSDLLLIFLLKGARPWKYRDNAKPDAEAQDAGVLGWEQQQALSDLADEVMAEREHEPSTGS